MAQRRSSRCSNRGIQRRRELRRGALAKAAISGALRTRTPLSAGLHWRFSTLERPAQTRGAMDRRAEKCHSARSLGCRTRARLGRIRAPRRRRRLRRHGHLRSSAWPRSRRRIDEVQPKRDPSWTAGTEDSAADHPCGHRIVYTAKAGRRLPTQYSLRTGRSRTVRRHSALAAASRCRAAFAHGGAFLLSPWWPRYLAPLPTGGCSLASCTRRAVRSAASSRRPARDLH